MPRQVFLNIDSYQRTSNSTSSSDFSIQLPQIVPNCRKVSLLSLELPFTVYSVRSGLNNTFKFSVSGTFSTTNTYTATITSGNYSVTSLISAIATAVSATSAGVTISCSYSSTTMKTTITSSDSTFTIKSCTLATMLGFVAGQSGTSITSTNVSLNSLDNYIHISLPQLSTQTYSQYTSTFRVPVSVSSGSILYADWSSAQNPPSVVLDQPTTIGTLQVKLYDQFGNSMSLNGADWSCTLMCTIDAD